MALAGQGRLAGRHGLNGRVEGSHLGIYLGIYLGGVHVGKVGSGHFGLRAHWGTRSGGTVLPGKGRTTPTPGQEATHLDVWLNDEACWAAVPTAVWATTLGGYPVLKKWLSYRGGGKRPSRRSVNYKWGRVGIIYSICELISSLA